MVVIKRVDCNNIKFALIIKAFVIMITKHGQL